MADDSRDLRADMSGAELQAERAKLNAEILRTTAEGGHVDIAFEPSNCDHAMRIGPHGVFMVTPCSSSEVNEVQARKVIAALTGWLEAKASREA